MAELPLLFNSPAVFRDAFVQRLEELIDNEGLGVYILALANASFERPLYDRLAGRLEKVYRDWGRAFDDGAARALAAAPDDAAVFERLRAVGLDRLEVTQWRAAGSWQLQFNPLRGFRPPRMSGAVVDRLHKPFDGGGFHFNKPFLRQEILWEGQLIGRPTRLFYNKYPFADLHGLLVPEPEACHPQYLTRELHGFAWQLAAEVGARLPDLGLGYNAYGAYASVNHLHLQTYLRTEGRYPIEAPFWSHNGGATSYPLAVHAFEDEGAAWSLIAHLHEASCPYNLLFRPGRLYVTPRRFQGSFNCGPRTGGFAWSEVAGAITTFTEQDFFELDEGAIAAEFAALRVEIP